MSDLRLLSLGAGVQSTTLALMVACGELETIDGAIFADTKWEPRRVYEHLDRLEKALVGAGVPVYRVSKGDLRKDAIDPEHRYASIPYFVRNAPYDVDVPTEVWAPCDHDGGAADECTKCDMLGGAVTVSMGSRPATLAEREGQGRRQCTSEYKLAPIGRKVRELLGANAPDFRRVPKGRVAEQWVGFSTDEAWRANPVKDAENVDGGVTKTARRGVSYLTTRYPLLNLGMSRSDCTAWLNAHGWTDVAKSACIGCPYHGNRQWRDLRDNHPDEWADAVEFDEAIRKGGARGLPLDGEAFLHRSRVPLSIAPIDHVTRNEKADLAAERASSLFGNPGDVDEDGDPDGCSPYGCRSGSAS
jgi:hypothetical protein